jgi:PAS domain-containing protein
VPLSSVFQTRRFVERAQRIRENPIAAYSIALAAVVIATLLRWAVGPFAISPFTTYYAAILLATFFGGFWPGVLAMVASAIIVWFVFLPPEFSFALTGASLVSLLLFILVTGIIVTLVTLLNNALERVLAQEQNVRVLIESAPNGIVVVDDRGIIRSVNRATEKLFGYDRLELLGQSVEVLVPASQAKTHNAERESF